MKNSNEENSAERKFFESENALKVRFLNLIRKIRKNPEKASQIAMQDEGKMLLESFEDIFFKK